jgi:hypothetical protein
LADRLIEEEDGEFQKWYDNLCAKYDIIFDLHDNWTPRVKREFVKREAKKQGLGHLMKDGYVAVKDHELPYVHANYRCYSRNIDDALHIFETRWNWKHEWRHAEFNKFEQPLFLKPSADVEMTVEFIPVRIIYRPKRIRRIRVSTGTSFITELIQTLRSS